MTREETMRRLGAKYEKCRSCEKLFNTMRLPRFWVLMYTKGELSELISDPNGILVCSRACGDNYKKYLPDHLDNSDEVEWVVHEEKAA